MLCANRNRRLRARARLSARPKRRRNKVVNVWQSDDRPKAGESVTLDTLQRDVLVPHKSRLLDATTDPKPAKSTWHSRPRSNLWKCSQTYNQD